MSAILYNIALLIVWIYKMEKDFSFNGDNLDARFGHTITPIGKEREIIFGGAVGDTGSIYHNI